MFAVNKSSLTFLQKIYAGDQPLSLTLYLALQNIEQKWHTVQHWKEALRHFTLRWGERIDAAHRTN